MRIKSILSAMAVTAALLGIVSCGNKNKAGGSDEAAPADTGSVAGQAQEEQAEAEKELLQTPDLTLFELKGNVKTATVKGTVGDKDADFESTAFDEQGRLTVLGEYNISYNKVETGKVTNEKGQRVKRDKQGRILYVGRADGCSGQEGRHFTYSKNGYKDYQDTGECSWLYDTTVTLGADGLPATFKATAFDESGDYEINYTFTYTKFDDKGNWTERTVKWNSVYNEYNETEDGKEENIVTKDNGTLKQTRSITYYGE